MCLNGWSYRERLAKEAFWSPATGDSKEDSDSAVTPGVEAVRVPAHLVLPGSPQAKQLHPNSHAQLSLGQSCHRQKIVTFMCTGSIQSCPTLCNPVDCGLSGFSVTGILQARMLEHIGQYSLPYPSQFSSVQLLSHVWLFLITWTIARQASLSITNSWNLPKLMSIESVMPSNHLILCPPLLLPPSIFPSIRVFSNESALHIRWPKYWSFSFNISLSNEHPGLISFRMDRLDLLAVQGTLKSLLQHHSSKASILWH